MRISDGSSDVSSSDLPVPKPLAPGDSGTSAIRPVPSARIPAPPSVRPIFAVALHRRRAGPYLRPLQWPSRHEPSGSVEQDRRAVADRAVVHHHRSQGDYRVHQSQLLRSAPTTRFPAPPIALSGASAPSIQTLSG